jgi:hypothetical protein
MADETKIIRIVVDSSRAVDGSAAATRALQALEKQAAASGGVLARMEKSIDSAGAAIKAFIVYDLSSRLLEMAKSALEVAAGLDELAQQLGVSAQYLQAVQFAAVQSGVKLEQLETGISKFSQKMGEAAAGNKDMIDSLNSVGVKILDTHGKLRPTEELLTNIAQAILKIDDPAKRASAAVDFFGKAGTRMLPLLAEMAKGLDGMGKAAKDAGAMISDETIAKLDALADRSERTRLVMRALFAENAAGPLTAALDFINGRVENLSKLLKAATSDWKTLLLATPAAVLAPGAILGSILGPTASGAAQSTISGAEKQLATLMTERGQFTDPTVTAEYDKKIAEQNAIRHNALVTLERLKAGPGKFDSDVTAPPVTVVGDGAGQPGVKGAGDDVAKRLNKQVEALKLAAAAQNDMTAAARAGDQAFQEQDIKLKSLQQALGVYGDTAKATDPQVRALAKSLEEWNRQVIQGKAAEGFVLATTELEKQNEILRVQNKLINEAPEVQARELALLKAKNEEAKAGGAINDDDKERRRAAIEDNEKLKIQAEELKKAQELWTEPLKQALRDIQTTAANAFEEMLNSGNISFEALGQTFKKIIIRMAAEFLALATIRPIMSVVVNAVGGSGTASQMGLGGGGGGAGGGGLLGGGGGGLGSMFGGGGGGLGDMWAGATGGNGIGGLFQGAVPSQAGVMGPQMPGALNAGSGLQMGSFGMGNVSGALGVGMGAMSLLTNKKPTTASTIGGVGQMVGGALMMIPTPWTMAAGAVISLASSVLPGLFGGTPEPPKNDAQGSLIWGGNGFFTNGGAYGPDANSTGLENSLKGVSGGITSLFNSLGGVKDASKVYGLDLQSFAQGDFKNQTSFIVGPDGSRKKWGQGSTEQDVGLGTASAEVALESILGGAVGKITDNMRKALDSLNDAGGPATLDQIQATVTEVKSFDDAMAGIGKTMTAAEQALKGVDDQFASFYATASKYGLDTTALDAAKNAARLKVGTDFASSITDQLLDPTTLALKQIGDERTALTLNNSALMGVAGYLDQTNNIEELYAKKRQKIIEDAAAAATAATQAAADAMKAAADAAARSIDALQATIAKLTYGDLSQASPAASLSGYRGSYTTTLAAARAGDATALGNLSGAAEAYANSARSYFGSSPEYFALLDQIRKDLDERVGAIAGGVSSSGTVATGSNAAVNAALQGNADLRAMVSDLASKFSQAMETIAALTAQLQRK